MAGNALAAWRSEIVQMEGSVRNDLRAAFYFGEPTRLSVPNLGKTEKSLPYYIAFNQNHQKESAKSGRNAEMFSGNPRTAQLEC